MCAVIVELTSPKFCNPQRHKYDMLQRWIQDFR